MSIRMRVSGSVTGTSPHSTQTIPIPNYAKGISIDFEGNVWAVSYSADAYHVNPTTMQIDTFTGLVGPYTYSDMTGFALSAAGGRGGRPAQRRRRVFALPSHRLEERR